MRFQLCELLREIFDSLVYASLTHVFNILIENNILLSKSLYLNIGFLDIFLEFSDDGTLALVILLDLYHLAIVILQLLFHLDDLGVSLIDLLLQIF